MWRGGLGSHAGMGGYAVGPLSQRRPASAACLGGYDEAAVGRDCVGRCVLIMTLVGCRDSRTVSAMAVTGKSASDGRNDTGTHRRPHTRAGEGDFGRKDLWPSFSLRAGPGVMPFAWSRDDAVSGFTGFFLPTVTLWRAARAVKALTLEAHAAEMPDPAHGPLRAECVRDSVPHRVIHVAGSGASIGERARETPRWCHPPLPPSARSRL